MRVLIIGGTRFVGRHLAQAAIGAGHDVSLFHRGRTGADLFPEASHLTGNRDGDMSALAAGSWDATIDVCAYLPRQVRSLAAALDGRGGQHLFISSVAVYRTPVPPGFREDAALAVLADPATQDVTDKTYGGLKVLCEQAARALHGPQRTTVIRPTYVVGPHDHPSRLAWWVGRLARGGAVLAPGEPADPIQIIDARDLAAWSVTLLERSVTGTFHAVSPPPPFGFGQLLEEIAAQVAPAGTRLTWVASDFLRAAGEDSDSLPLWPGGDDETDINAADPAAAYAAGLTPRPRPQTIADVCAEHGDLGGANTAAGISAEREAELLTRWGAATR